MSIFVLFYLITKLFRPILLLNFGRFPPYTIIKFWSFSTLYYYSALYYYYILVVFHPILNIIPTYTTIWNVRVMTVCEPTANKKFASGAGLGGGGGGNRNVRSRL